MGQEEKGMRPERIAKGNRLYEGTKSSPLIRARQISDADTEAMSEFFGRGLGYPPEAYRQIFELLRRHKTPAGFPKFGWLLEVNGAIAGGIILIYSDVGFDGSKAIRCHVTAWYFEPEFRNYASLFTLKALGHKDVTYLNISARPRAQRIIEAQGFEKYSRGQFLAFPILKYRLANKNIKVVRTAELPERFRQNSECDLLIDHEKFGCICVWCLTPDNAHPFVFQPRSIKRLIPGVRLIYCREINELLRFAGPLGSYLGLHGRIVISVDANEAIRGLPGRYFDGVQPRWYKGTKPRLGDLAYTLPAIFPAYG